MINRDATTIEQIEEGEICTLCNEPFVEDYGYALASKTDWQIHVRIKSKMDDLKETIKFPQKDIIFEIQNQTQYNETSTDTTDGQFSEPADY
jgi:hypothetical protein